MVGEHLPIDDGPRIHEDDLNIEQDEQHRHEVKLHREARAALADGILAAFVSGVLGLGAYAEFAEQQRNDERAAREADGGGQQEQNRNVLRQLGRLRIIHARKF